MLVSYFTVKIAFFCVGRSISSASSILVQAECTW